MTAVDDLGVDHPPTGAVKALLQAYSLDGLARLL